MYGDSIKQLNAMVGCKFDCIYCTPSFQKQMKRQKHNCMKCYNYEVHEHLERLNGYLPKTKGDEFIWLCSSSDISFAKHKWWQDIDETICNNPDKTFFIQTKDPETFWQEREGWIGPKNLIIGTTLETNRDDIYMKYNISKAPKPHWRSEAFMYNYWERKSITIEPILQFDLNRFLKMITEIVRDGEGFVQRIYIGYDTKNCKLPEPPLHKTMKLIKKLRESLPNCKIKTKLLRLAHYEDPKSSIEKWTEGVQDEF